MQIEYDNFPRKNLYLTLKEQAIADGAKTTDQPMTKWEIIKWITLPLTLLFIILNEMVNRNSDKNVKN